MTGHYTLTTATLTPLARAAYDYLWQHPGSTPAEVVAGTGYVCSIDAMRHVLGNLYSQYLIQREGTRRFYRFSVASEAGEAVTMREACPHCGNNRVKIEGDEAYCWHCKESFDLYAPLAALR